MRTILSIRHTIYKLNVYKQSLTPNRESHTFTHMVGLLPWPRHIYIIYIFYITNLFVCFICKSAMMYVHHSICICAQTVYFIARSPALHFEFERPFTFILIIAVQSSHSHRLETCRSRRSRSASEHSAVEKELQWWAQQQQCIDAQISNGIDIFGRKIPQI